MRTSDAINELAAALAKAQKIMPNAPKQSKGNFGTYSDLATLRDTITPALTENNIAVVQVPVTTDGKLLLVTRIIHQTGQWIEGDYPIPISDKPHVMGSALTYARRYSLAAIVNLAPDEDDDGQAAQDHHGKSGNGKKDDSVASRQGTDLQDMTGDVKAKGYKTNGTTLGAVKAQSVNALYTRLTQEIRDTPSVEALKEWKKLQAREINSLPPDWIDHLAEEYERQKDELTARIAA